MDDQLRQMFGGDIPPELRPFLSMVADQNALQEQAREMTAKRDALLLRETEALEIGVHHLGTIAKALEDLVDRIEMIGMGP